MWSKPGELSAGYVTQGQSIITSLDRAPSNHSTYYSAVEQFVIKQVTCLVGPSIITTDQQDNYF